LSIRRRPEFLQQHGAFHGGVTAFLIDNATTFAAWTQVSLGHTVITAEYKISFLSPAIGDDLICKARVVKSGRRLSIVLAEVFASRNSQDFQTAIAISTIASMPVGAKRPASQSATASRQPTEGFGE
jgi:uncharacterized protein (TIGR00369 family)